MEYQLTTLKDVFDKVPADRVDVCLKELAVAIKQAKAMAELLAATTTAISRGEVTCAVKWPETTTWIDDGKGTLDLKFQDEDGDSLFDYVVQLATDDEGSNAGNTPNGHPGAPPPTDDLAALVARLAHALRKAAPYNDLPEKALDYLQRKGLPGSPMRETADTLEDDE